MNSIALKVHSGQTEALPQKIVIKDKFVLQLPKSIDIKKAAFLLCAEITVYSPIMKLNIKKGDKIAVAGMGGIGYLCC